MLSPDNPEETTSQEAIGEEVNEESSERIELQVLESNSQDVSKSELAQMEKWMSQIVWSHYTGYSLIVLADISFSLMVGTIDKFPDCKYPCLKYPPANPLYALGFASSIAGPFLLSFARQKLKKIKDWEKQLTDKNAKLLAIQNRLSLNKRLINSNDRFGSAFFIFSCGGALLAATGSIIPDSDALTKSGAFFSFYGLIGERIANWHKERHQSEQKSLRKEEKKLLKELEEELIRDNNSDSAKEINSELSNNQQQEITDNNQQYETYQLQEIIPSSSRN